MSDPTPIVIVRRLRKIGQVKNFTKKRCNVAVMDQNLIHGIVFWDGSKECGLRSKKSKAKAFKPCILEFVSL